ncbi:hypothetical protein FRAHR75_1660003 [Frankia sp. Hr75.2]|nr:hypothetical protein FRAHR75_1660003 [Frankia sp. Hr75.2]
MLATASCGPARGPRPPCRLPRRDGACVRDRHHARTTIARQGARQEVRGRAAADDGSRAGETVLRQRPRRRQVRLVPRAFGSRSGAAHDRTGRPDGSTPTHPPELGAHHQRRHSPARKADTLRRPRQRQPSDRPGRRTHVHDQPAGRAGRDPSSNRRHLRYFPPDADTFEPYAEEVLEYCDRFPTGRHAGGCSDPAACSAGRSRRRLQERLTGQRRRDPVSISISGAGPGGWTLAATGRN